MKKRELYKITAYHCAHCGAPTRPDRDLCDWCAQKALLKHYQEKRNFIMPKVRVLVETGGNYINFDQINDISITSNQIEATRYYDYEKRYIAGRKSLLDDWHFTMLETDRSYELIDKLTRKKDYNIRIEALEEDKALELSAYFLDSKNELVNFDLCFSPTDYKGLINTIVPKDITCPNCGAPINSRLGACAYCGGWVEFEF